MDFAPLAYAFDAGSAPGLLIVGASLPGFVAPAPALAGRLRIGPARLQLPRVDE